jgi:hypothetical protein
MNRKLGRIFTEGRDRHYRVGGLVVGIDCPLNCASKRTGRKV